MPSTGVGVGDSDVVVGVEVTKLVDRDVADVGDRAADVVVGVAVTKPVGGGGVPFTYTITVEMISVERVEVATGSAVG